jgi:hypothetical protein
MQLPQHANTGIYKINLFKEALAPRTEPSYSSFHEGPKQSATVWQPFALKRGFLRSPLIFLSGLKG